MEHKKLINTCIKMGIEEKIDIVIQDLDFFGRLCSLENLRFVF